MKGLCRMMLVHAVFYLSQAMHILPQRICTVVPIVSGDARVTTISFVVEKWSLYTRVAGYSS
jgi:hypothetical protein